MIFLKAYFPEKEKHWKFEEEKNLPTPGVEPGPSGWKPDILAVRPRGIMFPSGIEPETFCVLGRCDNRYTTETCCLTLVGDGSSSSAVDLQSWCKYYFFLSALVSSRDRLVVRTLRCGRSNPGSNPGHGMDKTFLSQFSPKLNLKHCVGRESNPDQLLGRQLCWPLYHRRFRCSGMQLMIL